MTKGYVRHPLEVQADPVDAFTALYAQSPYSLWLDNHGERGHGVSYLAMGEPLPLTRNWRTEVRDASAQLSLPQEVSLAGVPLGVYLVLPYELGTETIGMSAGGRDPVVPHGLVVTRLVEINHDTLAVTACALGEESEHVEWVASLAQTLHACTPAEPVQRVPAEGSTWRDAEDRYREMIASAQSYIAKGDAYQLCVTTALRVNGDVDPVGLHRVLRTTNPTHHQALIRLGDVTLVSASPETFLQLSAGGTVVTRPIKGTRPRGTTPQQDAELAAELLESDKERAENLMIVDLMRNDLSRVARTGSVEVPELLVVETYATVHQLVSTITAEIREGLDLLDLLDATFPAGSMTGAPKRRAVEILQELESHPRGLYSGTYGVWRADGSAEFAMTIRTAVCHRGSLTLGVGGGITALSEPGEELREVGIKAQAFLSALGLQQVGYS
jgi:anthranilate synthase component 1